MFDINFSISVNLSFEGSVTSEEHSANFIADLDQCVSAEFKSMIERFEGEKSVAKIRKEAGLSSLIDMDNSGVKLKRSKIAGGKKHRIDGKLVFVDKAMSTLVEYSVRMDGDLVLKRMAIAVQKAIDAHYANLSCFIQVTTAGGDDGEPAGYSTVIRDGMIIHDGIGAAA